MREHSDRVISPPGLWPVLWEVTLALCNHTRIAVVEVDACGLRALVKRSVANYGQTRYLAPGPSARDADSLRLTELLLQLAELLASAKVDATVHPCLVSTLVVAHTQDCLPCVASSKCRYATTILKHLYRC